MFRSGVKTSKSEFKKESNFEYFDIHLIFQIGVIRNRSHVQRIMSDKFYLLNKSPIKNKSPILGALPLTGPLFNTRKEHFYFFYQEKITTDFLSTKNSLSGNYNSKVLFYAGLLLSDITEVPL